MTSLPTEDTNKPKHKFTNKLINEQSPYLLQHSHNPVYWYPWSKEAFDKAKETNKPIFLSIGYATCHWCHVMERESFEDESIANIMNELFVNIKIDREELPHVDRVYMTYVTATNDGHGGWPLSVFLTPTLHPIFGATYFPPKQFLSVLMQISKLWTKNASEIQSKGEEIMNLLNKSILSAHTKNIKIDSINDDSKESEIVMNKLFDHFENAFDNKLGGFGKPPKFPRPVECESLLYYWYKFGKNNSNNSKLALEMSISSVLSMCNGGIYDHLGGGFHRYSVDEYWHVPHFEKMLYDNAQLIELLLNCYLITKNNKYKITINECIDYILRDMTHKEFGGFFSGEDADSYDNEKKHKKEGLFYIFSENEIDTNLDKIESKVFKYIYFIKTNGNAILSNRSDPHNEFKKQNILYKNHSIKEAAKEFNINDLNEVKKILNNAKLKLFNYRNKTKFRPSLDDKIIVSWNGLMIKALAKAYKVLNLGDKDFNNMKYINSAIKCTNFILSNLYDSNNNKLYRCYRTSKSKSYAFASDYSCFINGLLELYEATFDVKWLEHAITLQNTQNKLFYDTKNGGYFDSSNEKDSFENKFLLLRLKEDQDMAEPATNSVSIDNLNRLYNLTGNKDYLKYINGTINYMKNTMNKVPNAVPLGCINYDIYNNKLNQIILLCQNKNTFDEGNELVLDSDNKEDIDDTNSSNSDMSNRLNSFLSSIYSNYMPNSCVIVINKNNKSKLVELNKEFFYYETEGKEDKIIGHICQNMVCKEPLSDIKKFEDNLSKL